MARVPFGEWKPSTTEEDEQATDFENEALRSEAERQARAFANGISESEPYVIGGTAQELDPKVTRGLLEAKKTP